MKQLNVVDLNAKDVGDHLPADDRGEEAALQNYSAAGIHLHAAGVISFTKDEDADIRAKFEYAKRARIPVIVGGDPAPETLTRIERVVKEYDIRVAIHNHGPEDRIWHSPLDVLKAVRSLDPRIGCCIDVGHTVRTGTDVVQAIHEAGPRLYNMHMKDLANFHNKESQVPVGDGKMPVGPATAQQTRPNRETVCFGPSRNFEVGRDIDRFHSGVGHDSFEDGE